MINVELQNGCVSFVTSMALTHTVYPIKTGRQTSIENCGLRDILLMFIWKLILCLIYIFLYQGYTPAILLTNEEHGFYFWCLFCVQAVM